MVVVRATGRAVCLAFAAALRRLGVPGEVLTDNGKQFTDRFGKGGEVLFDRICRDNGITHRLTQPRHPTTTGKIERFHGSLRRELLADAVPFADLAAAQAAVDVWVGNTTPPGRIRRSGWIRPQPGSALPRRRLRPGCCRCGCPRRSPWPRCLRYRPKIGPPSPLRSRCQLAAYRIAAARWSSTGWSRPAGTWRCGASSSGSAPYAPGWSSRSGPASMSST